MTDRTGSVPEWLASLREQVSERLRAQKATQKGLAEHLGVSPKHINQMLRGHIAGDPALLAAMAEAVGLEIAVRDSGRPPAPLAKNGKTLAGQRQRIAAAILAEQEPCPVHPAMPAAHLGCPVGARNAALETAASVARDETPGGAR